MPMQKYLWAILLTAACVQAQSTAPGSSSTPSSDGSPPKPVVRNDDLFPAAKLDGKVSLVRGVLKRVDPIHDQFVVQAFGGGEIKVGFDGQTKFLSAASTSTASTPNASTPDALNIPAGSVISLDVVTEGGRLFAKSVRTGTVSPAEINGQVVGYDPTRSRLTLRDAASMKEFSLRINPSTSIVNQGHPISAQALATGMLVRAHFSAKENAASDVEVLAERGRS